MRKWMIFCLGTALSASVSADPFEIVGSQPIVVPSNDPVKARAANVKKNIVYVQKIQLSADAKRIMAAQVKEVQDNPTRYYARAAAVVSKVAPDMNWVPVLDQGAHGTCVTFAITGAIDAIIPGLNRATANYVSQLCSLALGSYLVSIGSRIVYIGGKPYSGWDGSNGRNILSQLNTYGILPISHQNKYGCAKVKSYPLNQPNNRGNLMSISEYTASALTLSKYVGWASVFDYSAKFSPNYNANNTLNLVKKHLRERKNLVFGMLLDSSTGGGVGASGHNAVDNDTWVLTPKIVARAQAPGGLRAGHELIITGYDDDASLMIKDDKGLVVCNKQDQGSPVCSQKGVLILRNSWSQYAGDKGNYYMSYDYFKAFATDAQVLCTAKLYQASRGTCNGVDTKPVRK